MVWVWPAQGTVVQGFSWNGSGGHPGFDISSTSPPILGTAIVAAAPGTVTFAGPASGFGNAIIVTLADGLQNVYGHMYDNGILVRIGQQVAAGQRIGLVGSNGDSTGPHLHFEVRNQSGQPIDPSPYLSGSIQWQDSSSGEGIGSAVPPNSSVVERVATPIIEALPPSIANWLNQHIISPLENGLDKWFKAYTGAQNPAPDRRLNRHPWFNTRQGVMIQADSWAAETHQPYPFRLNFLYNPSAIQVSGSLVTDQLDYASLTAEQRAATATIAGSQQFSFDLLFNRMYEVFDPASVNSYWSILPKVGARADVYAFESLLGMHGRGNVPSNPVPVPLVVLFGGSGEDKEAVGLSFVGFVNSYSVNYASFSHDMIPTTATISVSMTQIIGTDPYNALTNPNFNPKNQSDIVAAQGIGSYFPNGLTDTPSTTTSSSSGGGIALAPKRLVL